MVTGGQFVILWKFPLSKGELSKRDFPPFVLQISPSQIKYVIETLNLTEHRFSLSIGATVTYLAALKFVFWELVPFKNVIHRSFDANAVHLTNI